jgi:hypothetical protein
MIETAVQFKVDQLAGFAGFLFLAAVCFYPSTFINLFLNKVLHFNKNTLLILATAGLISSLFTSYSNKAIFENKDKLYSIIALAASVAAISFCIIFSFFSQSVAGIFLSILTGELVSTLGLIKICGNRKEFLLRMTTSFKYLLLLIIPLIARWYWADSYIAFFSGLGVMGLIFLLTFYKKFNL